MKTPKLLALFTAAVLTIATTPLHARDITFLYTYDFSSAAPCTATVTTSCVVNFEAKIWSLPTATTAATVLTTFSVPLPPSPSGLMRRIEHVQRNVTLLPGHYKITLEAVFRLNDGTLSKSRPAEAGYYADIEPPSEFGASSN